MLGVELANPNLGYRFALFATFIVVLTKEKSKMSIKPASASFWSAYLNYVDYDASSAWTKIGGNIGKAYGPNGNSCAARVSWGLNYSGAEVEAHAAASRNFSDQRYNGVAGDDKRYIVSAMQMAAYLKEKWGAADHQVSTQEELDEVLSSLGAKCAVFATPKPPGGNGHAGVLKSGYKDPHVENYLPVDVWILP